MKKVLNLRCEECNRSFECKFTRECCFECRPMDLNWTYKQCLQAAKQCESQGEFAVKYANMYIESYIRGWLEKVSKEAFSVQFSIDHCLSIAKTCNSREVFSNVYPDEYEYAKKKNWLTAICTHMPPPSKGYRRTHFVESCKRNHGYGILYLLLCYNLDEAFYKIGITSRTIKDRYRGNRELPYDYEVVWQVLSDPTRIWDKELELKQTTKDCRYSPKLPFGGSVRECFMCHPESSIILEPVVV